jgi:S1-C subfamily serine protease
VVAAIREKKLLGNLAIFFQRRPLAEAMAARLLVEDEPHDLAILKVDAEKLKHLKLGERADVDEGMRIAMCGYPYGMALGPFPTTHVGIISNISPIVIPVAHSSQLDVEMVRRLREPFLVYQVDAIAFPGNSGCPLFLPQNGKVIGVVNSVFVRETKENVLKSPTGITYAIPIDHAVQLIEQAAKIIADENEQPPD